MTKDVDFAPGQVWTYRGAQPEGSRVVIGAVDTVELPDAPAIVSIAVTDALLPDLATGAMRPQLIQHAPLAADALERSVIERDGEGLIPDGFDDGYRTWRRSFRRREGGFFTVTVEELVRMFQTALGPQHGPVN